jgi:hypothetical protein
VMNSSPKQNPLRERMMAGMREGTGVSNSISSKSPGFSRMPAYKTMPPSLNSVPRPSTTVVENPFEVTTRTGISTGSRSQRRVFGGVGIQPMINLVRGAFKLPKGQSDSGHPVRNFLCTASQILLKRSLGHVHYSDVGDEIIGVAMTSFAERIPIRKTLRNRGEGWVVRGALRRVGKGGAAPPRVFALIGCAQLPRLNLCPSAAALLARSAKLTCHLKAGRAEPWNSSHLTNPTSNACGRETSGRSNILLPISANSSGSSFVPV